MRFVDWFARRYDIVVVPEIPMLVRLLRGGFSSLEQKTAPNELDARNALTVAARLREIVDKSA
jgi:hypothetical protein